MDLFTHPTLLTAPGEDALTLREVSTPVGALGCEGRDTEITDLFRAPFQKLTRIQTIQHTYKEASGLRPGDGGGEIVTATRFGRVTLERAHYRVIEHIY